MALDARRTQRQAPGRSSGSATSSAWRHAVGRLAGEFPKPWTDETVRAADVVVLRALRGLVPHGLVRLHAVGPPDLTSRGRWVLDGPDGPGRSH